MNLAQKRALFQTFQRIEAYSYLEELLQQGRILAIVEDLGPDARPIPIVRGETLRYNSDRVTIMAVDISCPWCGKPHTHSAGPNPGQSNGHRVAHCTAHPRINSGYIIQESPVTANELWAIGTVAP